VIFKHPSERNILYLLQRAWSEDVHLINVIHSIISVSSVFIALGFTQPLTKMGTRNIKIIMFLGRKVWLVRRADNFIAIYEPIV
jgi:hypothetical protein